MKREVEELHDEIFELRERIDRLEFLLDRFCAIIRNEEE